MGSRALTMEETITQVALWFAEYMQRPQMRTHLHGKTPGEVFQAGRGEGLSVADIERLTLLMLQKEVRTITKDGIRLNGRLYWHERLASRRHPVLVRYDEQLSPHEVLVYTLDGVPLCVARDRAHYGIASGLHPAAGILGTDAQRAALAEAMALKKGQERGSAATVRHLLDGVVLPEARARMAALQAATPAPEQPAPAPNKTPGVSAAEAAAIEAAMAKGRAAREAAPSYTPSGLKRWRDAPERYAYLFDVRWRDGIALVPADQAWMGAWERSDEYQRYHKRRFEALRGLYDRQRASA